MSASSEHDLWYTVAEARDYLKVSNTTLYQYMKDRRLPFFYLAGTRHRRLKKSDLDALLTPGDPDELDAADEEVE